MAYDAPSYDYARRVQETTHNKNMGDIAGDYGRFISQERFRRTTGDMGDQFRRQMPKVGSQFNRRGIYNSGLRQQGQRDFAQNYQQQLGRAQYDQAAEEQKFGLERSASDANYKILLQQLFEQLQGQRAQGYDPYAAVRQF